MASAIKRVTVYTASPVEMCERCGQGIKYVALVTYQDGFTAKYGMDCIERVMSGDTSLKSLFLKNVKRLRKFQDYLVSLSLPFDQMPKGSEYYNSGLYMVADSHGKDILFNHYYFHPIFDAAKNSAGGRYVVNDSAEHVAGCVAEIEAAKPKISAEIQRLENFLAKALSKYPSLRS